MSVYFLSRHPILLVEASNPPHNGTLAASNIAPENRLSRHSKNSPSRVFTAMNSHSVQTKTAPKGAVFVCLCMPFINSPAICEREARLCESNLFKAVCPGASNGTIGLGPRRGSIAVAVKRDLRFICKLGVVDFNHFGVASDTFIPGES